MKGNSGNATTAVYGTQGVPAAANTPHGLYEMCEWRDKQGNFWIYGGLNAGFYSNLWRYDPITNEWAWMKGPGAVVNQTPVYGTQGVPNINNTPGARGRGSASWVDTSGNLWLFGGDNGAEYDDLWKYDISTNEWTWMSGTTTQLSSGVYGTLGIPSSANHPGARRETNAAWCDAGNNLWMFGGYGYDFYGSYIGVMNDLWKYNIATNEWTWMRGSEFSGNYGSYGTLGVSDTSNNPPARMVYTKWIDTSGNFWIFGGGDYNTDDYYNDVWKYDPDINEWTWMSGTNLVNNDGNTSSLCTSGIDLVGPARFENRACWTDKCNGFWTFGGSRTGNLLDNYNDLWFFNSQSLEWTQAEGSVIANQSGSYGTQGVSDPSNQPPSRGGSIAWRDDAGNLWMFGGADQFVIMYNDIWRYVSDPSCPPQNLCTSSAGPQFFTADTDVCEKFCISFFDTSQNNPTSWQWLFPGGSPSSSALQNPANICYDIPGVYDVTLITTSVGGTDTLTLSNYITVYATPPFPTITQVGYTLTSSAAVTYQWQLNSGNIPGATNQSYTVLQSGYYTVIVSDSNGCVNSASIKVTISGIDEVSDMNVSIYPNPSSGNFIIEWLNGPGMVGEISIDVMNMLGQKVFSAEEPRSIGTADDVKKKIDLNDVARGIYFIEIKTEKEFMRKKILIAD